MLLTIATTHRPATDLGFLLHKHPARAQAFDLSFGRAHVFYPEASEERCTAALLLEVDPVGLVRRKAGGERFALWPYVNDRPYASSSFLSVAIAEVYGSALAGRSKERPELAAAPVPLAARLAAVPVRGGEEELHQLFAPLGYEVTAERHPLDPAFPGWGDGPYFTLELQAETRLRDLLAHLYVLVPALDDDKHYWVGDDEVDKLLRHGAGWLATHPARELIAARYLKRRRSLVDDALLRLSEGEDAPDRRLASADAAPDDPESAAEERGGLWRQRIEAVAAVLRENGARRVLDLGCGEGRLLAVLATDPSFSEVVGVDASTRALALARTRVVDRLPPSRREQVRLVHGALTYRDRRLSGYDAAAAVEVIEHLDPARLAAFERVVFEFARPRAVVVTTPNAEYNVRFPDLPAGAFRHPDHRFEWTRAEFRAWAKSVAARFGYAVRFLPIGSDDRAVGPPTQAAAFSRFDSGGGSPAGSVDRDAPIQYDRSIEQRQEADDGASGYRHRGKDPLRRADATCCGGANPGRRRTGRATAGRGDLL